jgi:nucleoside-diphosphate-sugar epimerase
MMSPWNDCPVLVTGGASFIGSHLVDTLVSLGAWVRVADDFSSGKLENIRDHVDSGRVGCVVGDLKHPDIASRAMQGIHTVFHLAADHGGRGYLTFHQAACATNLLLDGTVFAAARQSGVEKIVFASSACVYPNHLQMDPQHALYLSEEMAGPPYDADNMYGWAKLMGEMTLRAYSDEWGVRTASCRYFTVYGERAGESHAIMAMIARAFSGQDPFEVWGTGEQVRVWTHVDDIVRGTILAAERIDDGSAVNLGTTERIRVIDAARAVLQYADYTPDIQLRPDMPTGPLNRASDNRRARKLLQWEPRVSFRDGLRRTMDWYFRSHNADEVRGALEERLLER